MSVDTWQTHTTHFACKKCKVEYKSMIDYKLEEAGKLDVAQMNKNMMLRIAADKTKCVKCKGKRFKLL